MLFPELLITFTLDKKNVGVEEDTLISELLKSIGFIGFADKKCESPIKTT